MSISPDPTTKSGGVKRPRSQPLLARSDSTSKSHKRRLTVDRDLNAVLVAAVTACRLRNVDNDVASGSTVDDRKDRSALYSITDSDSDSESDSDSDSDDEADWIRPDHPDDPINPNDVIHLDAEDAKDMLFLDQPKTSPNADQKAPQPAATAKRTLVEVFFLLALWKKIFRISRTAFQCLLSILTILIAAVSMVTGTELIDPNTINLTSHRINAAIGLRNDQFERRVLCNADGCWHISPIGADICFAMGELRTTRYCHNQVLKKNRKYESCMQALAREVRIGGKTSLVAKTIMCQSSLTTLLGRLLRRPGMVDHMKSWQSRQAVPGVYRDVYDGRVFKAFWGDHGAKEYEQKPTERDGDDRLALAFGLNVDWFAPFKHIKYSVGVVYWTILNLPRDIRYKPCNILISHILPTGREKGVNMTSVLKEAQAELQRMWDTPSGIAFQTNEPGRSVWIRAALMMIACDQPAARKVSGFVAVGGTYSCHRCLKKMTRIQSTTQPLIQKGKRKGKPNMKTSCSGFSDDEIKHWLPRDPDHHRFNCNRWAKAKSITARKKITRETGCTHTAFKNATPMNIIDCTIIDPMHNVYMGTGSKIIKLLKRAGVLDDAAIATLHALIKRVALPRDLGAGMARKIKAGFSSMSADELKLFWLVFAEPFLKRSILGPKFTSKMRRLVCAFAAAVRLVSSAVLTTRQINEIGTHLLTTCRLMEDIFGASSISINQHLHVHLTDCLLDFGPSPAFNLFALERMNGALGRVPHNLSALEVSVMRHLSELVSLMSTPTDTGGWLKLSDQASKLNNAMWESWAGSSAMSQNSSMKSAMSQAVAHLPHLRHPMQLRLGGTDIGRQWSLTHLGNEASPSIFPLQTDRLKDELDDKTYDCLCEYFRKILPLHEVTPPRLVHLVKSIDVLGEKFGSISPRSTRQATCLIAHGHDGATSTDSAFNTRLRIPFAAQTQFFIQFNVPTGTLFHKAINTISPTTIDGGTAEHCFKFAIVKWYKLRKPHVSSSSLHPASSQNVIYGTSYKYQFHPTNWSCIVPVDCIVGRFAPSPIDYNKRLRQHTAFRPLALPRRVYF